MNLSDVMMAINAISKTSDIQLIDSEDHSDNDSLFFSFKKDKLTYLCEASPVKDKNGATHVKKVDFSIIVRISDYMKKEDIYPMINKLNLGEDNGCVYMYSEDLNHYAITSQARVLKDSSYSSNVRDLGDGKTGQSSIFLSWKIMFLESILFLIKAYVSLSEEQKKYRLDNNKSDADEE